MGVVEGLTGIAAGLVLLTGVLSLVPALGAQLEKLARALGGFQALIGVVALVVGILALPTLMGIALIVGGLVLALGILPSIPAVGKHLAKASKALAAFQVPIGVIVLVLAVLELL